MAKPTANAANYCIGLSVLLLAGIIFGFLKNNALVIIIALLPVVGYEVYRTEGESTKAASCGLLGAIILEIIAVIFKINLDLASFLGTSSQYVAGYHLPLGDIKVIFPGLMAILSVVLFTRTNGVYTKWLAVLIFIGSLSVVYTLNPEIFRQFIRLGINEGLRYISF